MTMLRSTASTTAIGNNSKSRVQVGSRKNFQMTQVRILTHRRIRTWTGIKNATAIIEACPVPLSNRNLIEVSAFR